MFDGMNGIFFDRINKIYRIKGGLPNAFSQNHVNLVNPVQYSPSEIPSIPLIPLKFPLP
jgi:hypothetical protein